MAAKITSHIKRRKGIFIVEKNSSILDGHSVAALVAHAISYPDSRERDFIMGQKEKAMGAGSDASLVAYAIANLK